MKNGFKIRIVEKRLHFLWVIMSIFIFADCTTKSKDQIPGWTHFYIDEYLPGENWGTGGPALADFDMDGDLDVAISRRTTQSAYWYERVNDSIWVRHLMGQSEKLAETLGTTPIDIDHDGWVDVVFQGVWFKNPGNLKDNPDASWQSAITKASGHDEAAVDIDANGKADVLVYDGKTIAWYNTSDSLKETIIDSGYHDHGGCTPHGFGDLDGDNDIDVVIPGYWFANPGSKDMNWIRHEWPFDSIPKASYGRSIRSWVVDLNNDGNNDIVYSHCDTGNSHVYWIENKGKGSDWEVHKLPDPPTQPGDVEGTGSFHSLAVADFNQDGQLDIFAGEQEDPCPCQLFGDLLPMKVKGLKERGVIWYSKNGKYLEFDIDVIQLDNPGWHDAQIGDVDGDGDLDIVSKIWASDGKSYHSDYWRNEQNSCN